MTEGAIGSVADRPIESDVAQVLWLSLPDLSRHLHVSASVRGLWGCSAEEAVADPDRFLAAIQDTERPALLRVLQLVCEVGEQAALSVHLNPSGGAPVPVTIRAFPVKNVPGHDILLACLCSPEDHTGESLGDAHGGAREEARESRFELLALNEIARAFLRDTPQEIFPAVLTILLKAMESDTGLLVCLDETGVYRLSAATADVEKVFDAPCDPRLAPSVFEASWQHDFVEKGPYVSNSAPVLGGDGLRVRNVLCAPIVHDRAVIGLFAVANHATGYGPHHVSLMRAVGTQTAAPLQGLLERQTYARERQRLEQQLRASQKMEAIGTLASGIAHDFNNILSGVLGFALMVKDDLDPGTATHDDMEEVVQAATRAKELVGQILAFSRQAEQEKKPIHLRTVLKEISKLLRGSIPTTIDIVTRVFAADDLVMGDASQIHQVIMNLCTNAYHAVRQFAETPSEYQRSCAIHIELRNRVLEEADQARIPGLTPGTYVELVVRDTGHGMDAGTMEKIFDPYFTTKEKGEGTGLGLATVQGIVAAHNGAIEVESTVDGGSTFRVFFPVHREAKEEVPQRPSGSAARGKGERILFVDDEETIVEIATRGLVKLGYQVDGFGDGPEALRHFRNHPEAFDAVVTDLTMPRLTGLELAHIIRQLRPGIPIILCTGFSEKLTEERAAAAGVREVVYKPVVPGQLAAVINHLVAESRAATN